MLSYLSLHIVRDRVPLVTQIIILLWHRRRPYSQLKGFECGFTLVMRKTSKSYREIGRDLHHTVNFVKMLVVNLTVQRWISLVFSQMTTGCVCVDRSQKEVLIRISFAQRQSYYPWQDDMILWSVILQQQFILCATAVSVTFQDASTYSRNPITYSKVPTIHISLDYLFPAASIPSPSRSPNIYPIEYVWYTLGRFQHPKLSPCLEKQFENAW